MTVRVYMTDGRRFYISIPYLAGKVVCLGPGVARVEVVSNWRAKKVVFHADLRPCGIYPGSFVYVDLHYDKLLGGGDSDYAIIKFIDTVEDAALAMFRDILVHTNRYALVSASLLRIRNTDITDFFEQRYGVRLEAGGDRKSVVKAIKPRLVELLTSHGYDVIIRPHELLAMKHAH